MIKVGNKGIVGGYIGGKKIARLYVGNILVYPPSSETEQPTEPSNAEISVTPQSATINSYGDSMTITITSTGNWTATVYES